MIRDEHTTQIAIVGPCASGKSTLADQLQQVGYQARQIVQEHSYVPDMWQVVSGPDLLIFLDASFSTCSRRKSLNWRETDYHEQLQRLRHAREHCDIYIQTDSLGPNEVLEIALREIHRYAGDRAR